MADNLRGVPATPTPAWLTRKRKNKKYGGRRGSLGGRREGTQSNNVNGGALTSGRFRAIHRSVSASSSLDYEVGANGGFDLRTQARLERPEGNRSVASTFRIAEDPPDCSASVRLEHSDDVRQSGQRPPRPNSANTTTSCTDRNATQARKVHLHQFDFEPDNAEDGCGSSSTNEIVMERMQSDVARATAQATPFIASRSVVEENVQPNDISGDSRKNEIRPPVAHPPHDVTANTPAPTRQSARLQKKRSDRLSDNSDNTCSVSRTIPRLTARPWNFSSKRNTITREDDVPSAAKLAARSSPTSLSSRSQSRSQPISAPIDTSSKEQETGTANSCASSKFPSLAHDLVAASSTHEMSFLDDETADRWKVSPTDYRQRSASLAHLGSAETRQTSPTFQFSHKLSQSTPLSTSSRKRSIELFSSDGDEDELGGSERNRKRMPNALLPFDCLGGSERVRERGNFESFSLSQGDIVDEESRFFGARAKSLSQGDEPIDFPISPPSRLSQMKADLEFVAEDSADEIWGASCLDTGAIRSKDDDGMSLSSSSSSFDNDDKSISSSSNYQETEEEGSPLKALTDAQIFHSKSSYDDFKFLVKSLGTHVFNRNKCVATMGLNDGCMIALRREWSYERRGRFSKWIGEAFGFRIKPTGGTGGHYIHCSNAECRDAYDRLKKILKDFKGGRLPMDEIETEKSRGMDEGSTLLSQAPSMPESSFTMGLPLLQDFHGDVLAREVQNKCSLDEKKNSKIVGFTPVTRSITLQPQPTTVKPKPGRFERSSTLPCFDNSFESSFENSPVVENSFLISRPPRHSSDTRESLDSTKGFVGGSGFMCLGSPSPPTNRLPSRRLGSKPARTLNPPSRPSLDRPRTSFDSRKSLKPFESPHPRSCVVDPPSFMATPMPTKPAENWGSRPIEGKDWGESDRCCDKTCDVCQKIMAQAWFASEFANNKELGALYQIVMDAADVTSLKKFVDKESDDCESDIDSEIAGYNDDETATIVEEILDDDGFPVDEPTLSLQLARCESVGATGFSNMRLDDIERVDDTFDMWNQMSPCLDRRREMKLKKYRRMSLCVAAASDFAQPKPRQRCYRLSESPAKERSLSAHYTPVNALVGHPAFLQVLSYLSQSELIHGAFLVSQSWADSTAEALGKLMLLSVGCDPEGSDEVNAEDDESEICDFNLLFEDNETSNRSTERDWTFLMNQFPWATYISDGAFKKVYKVFNVMHGGTYEAISVMDIDAISSMGNLNLIGSELAISIMLSCLARRNICPNFVLMRAVFTCEHEPPADLWGSRDDPSPCGTQYDGSACLGVEPEEAGNFQYIRMELCEHGDIENFIKRHPDKMLPAADCRNLLFQIAFALHVAAERFGMKHYDVKLLNVLLQTAKDPTIPEDVHPHVVLRYGFGAHVFRLRMHHSNAYLAKLGDFGSSVLRSDYDGHGISLGQFTTLENTPPDYLILGNSATQGHGHDSFALGLAMLHLFTGHGPYEEVLQDLRCPDNFKGKLRRIWKQPSHDVLHSVIQDMDANGNEVEDVTLFDTLYRYLVLLGIPDKKFNYKRNGKVWRAISSTLLPPKSQVSKRCPDADYFNRDRKKYSLLAGTDPKIAHARNRLETMKGAMDLLLSLLTFDPEKRARPVDVINSTFMTDLVEDEGMEHADDDIIRSYTAYLTQ